MVIIVFNLSDKSSYEKAMKFYHITEELKSFTEILKIIVGNKTDLKEDEKYSKIF
jgi:GTPase SAR1 family protein